MAYNVAAIQQNVARLMAYGGPYRFSLELVNQELLYATNGVVSATSAEPVSPVEGNGYIIPASGWGGEFPTFVAYFDGEEFLLAPPRVGQMIFVQDTLTIQEFNGTAWVLVPISPSQITGITAIGLALITAATAAAARAVISAAQSGVNADITALNDLKLRATTAVSVTVLISDQTIDVSAAAGTVTITYPLALVAAGIAKTVRINKTDTTGNQIIITSDGSTPIDAISAPASSTGQINGWRDLFSNGSNLRSAGVG